MSIDIVYVYKTEEIRNCGKNEMKIHEQSNAHRQWSTCACMHTHSHTHTHTHIHTCTQALTHTDTHVRASPHTHAHIHTTHWNHYVYFCKFYQHLGCNSPAPPPPPHPSALTHTQMHTSRHSHTHPHTHMHTTHWNHYVHFRKFYQHLGYNSPTPHPHA